MKLLKVIACIVFSCSFNFILGSQAPTTANSSTTEHQSQQSLHDTINATTEKIIILHKLCHQAQENSNNKHTDKLPENLQAIDNMIEELEEHKTLILKTFGKEKLEIDGRETSVPFDTIEEMITQARAIRLDITRTHHKKTQSLDLRLESIAEDGTATTIESRLQAAKHRRSATTKQ